jgi:glutamate-1-semialdehyde 2,1-aminomutase
METKRSLEIYERAQRFTTGGVNSTSRARSPHPLYFSRADGPYVWDVDDNRYVDLGMGNGAILLGHNNAAIRAAVEQALAGGLTTGLETETAVRAAELFLQIVPAAERVRFTNTGTEAMLHALQVARAKTGRQSIAKVEGAYHGWADPVYVSTWPNLAQAGEDRQPVALPGTGGLMASAIEHTVVLPFNDPDAAKQLVRARAKDLAAIVVEPTMIDVGFIPAEPEYLAALRQLADETGAVLIFDELLTGFRLARGGAQEQYHVQADLAIYGKALGNGFPVAAVAGKAEVMDLSNAGPSKAGFVGTFNGHAVTMAAAEASLQQLADGNATRQLQARTEKLIQDFQASAQRHHVPAQMQGRGGHIHWYFTDEPVRNYRQAARSNRTRYTAFANVLAAEDFLVSPNYLLHHAISLAHGQTELEQLSLAMDRGLAAAAQVKDGEGI